jgi:hypothetical protein
MGLIDPFGQKWKHSDWKARVAEVERNDDREF